MAHELLQNPRAEHIRRVAALRTRSGRRRQGEFIAEGPQPVRESILARRRAPENQSGLPVLRRIYLEEEALARHPDIAELIGQLQTEADLGRSPAAPVGIYPVTAEVMAAISDAETPQGMIAVCAIPSSERVWPQTRLGLGLCRVQDPGNMGTMIRTADAAGADAVYLTSGSVEPWSPKVIRSSAGSIFHLPIFTGVDIHELATWFRAQGFSEDDGGPPPQVLATAAQGSTALSGLAAPERPALWFLGNEAQGLDSEEQAAADELVSIPIYGQAESLNVATAATICLYHSAMAQHRVAEDAAQVPAQQHRVAG